MEEQIQTQIQPKKRNKLLIGIIAAVVLIGVVGAIVGNQMGLFKGALMNIFDQVEYSLELKVSPDNTFPANNTYNNKYTKADLQAKNFIEEVLFSDVDAALNLGLAAGTYEGPLYFRAGILDADGNLMDQSEGDVITVNITATAAAPECSANTDCTTAEKPVCNTRTGVCVACLTDTDCGAGFQCTIQKTCVEVRPAPEACTSNTDCTVEGLDYCKKAASECVECLIDTHCDEGFVCNDSNVCEEETVVPGEEEEEEEEEEPGITLSRAKAVITSAGKVNNIIKIEYGSTGKGDYDKYGVGVYNDENFEANKETTYQYLLGCQNGVSNCIAASKNLPNATAYLGDLVFKTRKPSQSISIKDIEAVLSPNRQVNNKIKLVPYLTNSDNFLANSVGDPVTVYIKDPAEVEALELIGGETDKSVQITFAENNRNDFENYGAVILMEDDLKIYSDIINELEQANVFQKTDILTRLDVKKDFLITDQVSKASDRKLKITLTSIYEEFAEVDENFNGNLFVIPYLTEAAADERPGKMVPDSDGYPKSIFLGDKAGIEDADVYVENEDRMMEVAFEEIDRGDYNQYILTVIKTEDVDKAAVLTDIIGEVENVTLRSIIRERAKQAGFNFYISAPVNKSDQKIMVNLSEEVLPELELPADYIGDIALIAGLAQDDFYLDETDSDPYIVTLTEDDGGEFCDTETACKAFGEECIENICTYTYAGCLVDTECADDEYCDVESGVCLAACTVNEDCEDTEICRDSTCYTPVSCVTTDVCAETDETCQNGYCLREHEAGPGGAPGLTDVVEEPRPVSYSCDDDLLKDFCDCDEDLWWFESMARSADQGEIEGYEVFPGSDLYTQKQSVCGSLALIRLLYPEGSLTYEQLITMLVRAIGATEESNVSFIASDWAQDYLKRAYTAGLIDENSLTFDFRTTVPRKEAIKLVLAAAGESYSSVTVSTPTYPDVTNLTSDDAKAIKKATDLGLVQGADDGNFYPDQILNRAEVVTIINRGYDGELF